MFDEGVTYYGFRLTPDDCFQPKENIPFPVTTLALAVGELLGGKNMELWGFPKEWKWDYYQKNRDKHHNASQANISSGGGWFGHENRREYGGIKPSGGGFGVTTRSKIAFGFGGGPISGSGFGNTNQYQDGGNGTGNQGGSNGDLGNVHCTIYKMVETHYKNSGVLYI